MDNNMFQRLKDLVTQHQSVGIVVPPNPTHDEMAAGLGMYLALKQMGKVVSIVCPTDPTVAISSLVGIDKVQKSFSPSGMSAGGDLVVTFPYREGEIEKVSYTVDNGQLNIVVKAGQNGLSFNQSDVQFRQGGNNAGGGAMPSLLFMMGVTDINQVAGVLNQAEMANTTTVNIDNKQTNTGFGDVVHVSPRFSSISEMVADFLTLLEPQIELDVDTSQDLLSGLLSANNDFQNGQGSYLAFEMAGILMKKGAVRSVNGNFANPTATQMPANNYFPPQAPAPQPVQNVQPMQQPVQPVQNMQPVQQASAQNFAQPQQFPPIQPQQPMQQAFEPAQPAIQQPMQPVQNMQPVQQPFDQGQQQQNQQPPADWLTPKVYKGSTAL